MNTRNEILEIKTQYIYLEKILQDLCFYNFKFFM